MDYGLSTLAIAKYGDLVRRELPQGWWVKAFADTFGDSRKAVSGVVDTGRAKGAMIHLGWDDNHSFPQATFKQLAAKAAKWRPLVVTNKQVQWRLSGACEHTLNPQQAQQLCDMVRDACPEAEYLNSPWQGRGAVLPGVINEIHGSAARPTKGRCQFDFDGAAAEDSDVTALKTRFAAAEVFWLWGPRLNGNWEMGTKVPRDQRMGWPDSNYLDSLIALANDRGDTKLPKNWTYKSHAENKGNGDVRAEKPVWLAPVNAQAIELRADNGQVIDVAKNYGTFVDGRYRLYSTQWGYLTAEKALRIQGHRLCRVFVNGKQVGIINPAFRDGSFR